METDSFQNNNSMFAEMLSNSNEKIILEATDQIFDQENPVSNVQNPDFADFDPKLEKIQIIAYLFNIFSPSYHHPITLLNLSILDLDSLPQKPKATHR